MPVYNRQQTEELFAHLRSSAPHPCYLLIGDRFLCRQAADKLCEIIGGETSTTHVIDGDREDINHTLQKIRTFSLFPGRQLYRVNDTSLFHSKNTLESQWKKIIRSHENGNAETAAKQLRAILAAAELTGEDSPHAFTSLSDAQWIKHFGFNKPSMDLNWTHDYLTRYPAPAMDGKKSPPGDDAAARFEGVLSKGIPQNNILILLAEEVDKRKRLYKYLKDHQVVIDLSVDPGSSAGAKKEQRSVLLELVEQTLSRYGKKISPGVADLLLERVGFHPVASVMEAEKLALYLDKRQRVEKEDIDLLVGRTRQEALFELTGALGDRDLDQTMLICHRLLENGYHSLMIIATLRNHIRSLLICRAIQQHGDLGFSPNMTAQDFQGKCLPILKDKGIWAKEFSGHPYGVYIKFKTAS
ncbi:MAG: hypothetical protein OEV64_10650, partial [Desulfobulbaceae bacterium]|nr:hypothetical protein [Desulfobulbaceae bacterium]